MPNNFEGWVYWGVSILFSGLLGSILTFWLAGIQQRKRDDEELRGFIAAIETEVQVLFEHYYNDTGKFLESLGSESAVKFIYLADQDYFTVYSTNADKIGRVPKDLGHKIVLFYTKIRSLLDTFKINNQMFIELERWKAIHNVSRDLNSKSQITAMEVALKNNLEPLKQIHFEAATAAEELKKSLKEYSRG